MRCHKRSELTSNGRSSADNGGGTGKSLVDGLIADTDSDNSAPVTTQGGDDSAGLTGGAAEIENAEEQFEIAAGGFESRQNIGNLVAIGAVKTNALKSGGGDSLKIGGNVRDGFAASGRCIWGVCDGKWF